MTSPYVPTLATVLSAQRVNDIATVSVRLSSPSRLTRPIAPADLRETDPYRLVFPLHQLVGRDGDVLVFETYDAVELLPPVGASHTLASWLLPEAFRALIDLSAVWTLSDYPDDGSHDHCLFSWAAISAHGEHPRAYRSSHGWVTTDAYRSYIATDFLRIRSVPRSIELAV